MAAGQYNVQLPAMSGDDELGELSQAFGEMAAQVRTHTENLEHLVDERTEELRAVNREMEAAHKNIADSIQYASLIQNAILPQGEIEEALGREYFVWWKPRDVVGGDFYVFRRDERGSLIGVFDCAGHGVPGALMTMNAHSIFQVAADQIGLSDPAAILRAIDERLRSTLQHAPQAKWLATHMDAALAYIDRAERTLTFSGAKSSLYWSDAGGVGEIKSARAALGGRRETVFENQVLPLDERSWYLATDGILDQSGGEHGFSFGHERFLSVLRLISSLPFEEQCAALDNELQKYQGQRVQRDDILVIGFGIRG
jgi:serine phosphatase RsbU (regulator of sigma subunit)